MDENEPRTGSGLKKLVRVVVVIGGFLAVAWAMRDRLISIPAPREAEPPGFLRDEADKPD
jgi:hypothetical protein